jgi:hypothetical protein
MLTRECIATIQSLPSGGLITDELRTAPRQALFALDAARASLLSNAFVQNPYIGQNLYSRTWLLVDRCDEKVGDCVFRYKLPSPPVDINGYGLAFGYVGDGECQSYTRIVSRSTLSSGSSLTKAALQGNVSYLYDPMFQMLELHYTQGMIPVDFCVEYVALHPVQIPEFNEEVDNYPITGELWRKTIDYLRTGDLTWVAGRPSDKVSNSIDDTTITTNK